MCPSQITRGQWPCRPAAKRGHDRLPYIYHFVFKSQLARLFSKSVVEKFPIESKKGFTFSIELLAKAYRNNYKIAEMPEKWPVRTSGESKFSYYSIPFYFKWYIYILMTAFKK